MGKVVISPNINKTKVQIDANGNEVKPFSKEIITPTEQPYVPKPEDIQAHVPVIPVPGPVIPSSPLSIQERIDQTKTLLDALLLEKQQEIAMMKTKLEELENS